MKTIFERIFILLLKLQEIWILLILPLFSVGVLKSILSNHPSPTVRRGALKALGGDVSTTCHLNQGVRIVMDYPLTSNIKIGERVAVAPNVQFICNSGPHSMSHLASLVYVKDHLIKDKKIIIGDDVWVGSGAIILPGVIIGRCSVIGAGALVIHDVPEFSIVAGMPAKVIRVLQNPSHDS